jgi:hypothetical protein
MWPTHEISVNRGQRGRTTTVEHQIGEGFGRQGGGYCRHRLLLLVTVVDRHATETEGEEAYKGRFCFSADHEEPPVVSSRRLAYLGWSSTSLGADAAYSTVFLGCS